MGFRKDSLLVLMVAATVALLWVFGRTAFAGITKWLLWALGVLCACAGVVALLDAEGRPLAYLGGFVLWAFAAYSIKVAQSLRKRS